MYVQQLYNSLHMVYNNLHKQKIVGSNSENFDVNVNENCDFFVSSLFWISEWNLSA